jgi:hypothetical protein
MYNIPTITPNSVIHKVKSEGSGEVVLNTSVEVESVGSGTEGSGTQRQYCHWVQVGTTAKCDKCGFVFPRWISETQPMKICGEAVTPRTINDAIRRRTAKIQEYKQDILMKLEDGSFVVADYLKGCQSCIPTKRVALNELLNEGKIKKKGKQDVL